MKKILTTTLAALLCAASVFAQAPAGSWQPLPASGYWQHLLHLGADFNTDMLHDKWNGNDPFAANQFGEQNNLLPFPGQVLDFPPGDVRAGSASSLVWTPMQNDGGGNPHALWTVGGNYSNYVKYWHIYILNTDSVARAVTAWFRHDDEITVWNNGNVFFSREQWDGEPGGIGQERSSPAMLHPGVNSITIKLHQGTGDEYMAVRLVDSNGDPIDDLFYALSPENPPPVVTVLAHNAVTLELPYENESGAAVTIVTVLDADDRGGTLAAWLASPSCASNVQSVAHASTPAPVVFGSLAADTPYAARYFVVDGGGEEPSAFAKFTTRANTPSLSMLSVSAPATNAVTVRVFLDWPGATPATITLHWGETDEGGVLGNWETHGLGSVSTNNCAAGEHVFNFAVPLENKPYYCRAFAANSHGATAAPTSLFFMIDTINASLTKTLWWGGGAKDILPGTPLPNDPASLSGVWNKTLKNWSIDELGTHYVAWEDGVDRVAWMTTFPHDTGWAWVALECDVTLNRLVVPHTPADFWNHRYAFYSSTEGVAISLVGENPEFCVSLSDHTRSSALYGNVNLAAPGGFHKGGSGSLNIEHPADGVIGRVVISGGNENGLWLRNWGLMRGVEEFLVLGGGRFHIDLWENRQDNLIASDALVWTQNMGMFGVTGWNACQEFGQLRLDHSAILEFSDRNTTLRATHPSQSIDRGLYGVGTVRVNHHWAGFNATVFVEKGQPEDKLLPWMWTQHSQPLRINPHSKALELVPVESAPADLSLWEPGTNYVIGLNGAFQPSGTLDSITIESLGFNCWGMNNHMHLPITDGHTLNIASGHIGLNGGHHVEIGFSGGAITTTAPKLYFLCGRDTATSWGVYSALVGDMDVVKAGALNLLFYGGTTNTYSGATYVNEGWLYLRKQNNVTAVPDDLFILRGGVSCGAEQMIARHADVTIHEGSLDTGYTVQNFDGVVTLHGGQIYWVQTGHIGFYNPGTGLVFANGGQIHGWGDLWQGFHLYTDVQYGPNATNQAVIAVAHQDLWNTHHMRLSENNMAPSVARTFDVWDSPVLPRETPELVIRVPLESDAAAPVELVKTGDGAMALESYTGRFTGTAKILDGALLVNGPFTFKSVINAEAADWGWQNWWLINLPTTEGLRFMQPIGVGDPPQGVAALVREVPGADSVRLSDWIPGCNNPPNPVTVTFFACGSLGRAKVEVSGTGTLGGIGGVGGNVLVDGGTFEPGTPAEPQGQLFVGGNLDFINNGAWQVNLLATKCNTAHIVGNVSLAGGVITPNFDPAKKRPKGVWDIATYEGVATGRMSAPKGCKTVIDETNKIIQFVSAEAGTLLMVR